MSTQLSSLLSIFPTLDLAALNEVAALQTRIDRKYTLTPEQAADLLTHLPSTSQVLDINGVIEHRYSSTYFDTPDLAAFYGSAHPRRRRFKVRVRRYDDSHLAFAEVKTRGVRSLTVKSRHAVPYEASFGTALPLSSLVWVHGELQRARCCVPAEKLRSVLHGSYRRSTVLMPASTPQTSYREDQSIYQSGSPNRLTIDTHLHWHDEQGRHIDTPNLVIVETKSSSSPSFADRWLWRQGIRPARISKYATALAALNPALPAHRWGRTLRRHFLHSPLALAA